jgi:hypothetical protein
MPGMTRSVLRTLGVMPDCRIGADVVGLSRASLLYTMPRRQGMSAASWPSPMQGRLFTFATIGGLVHCTWRWQRAS